MLPPRQEIQLYVALKANLRLRVLIDPGEEVNVAGFGIKGSSLWMIWPAYAQSCMLRGIVLNYRSGVSEQRVVCGMRFE